MSEDDVIGIVAIAAGISVIGGIIWLALYLDRKRTEAMHAFAEANGYTIDPDLIGFQTSMEPFKIFSQGHDRRLKNLIRATRGDLQIAVCDYQYTTGGGRHQHTSHQTLCVVQSAKRTIPHFFARRQVAMLDFLGKMFGGQDINFDEDPVFSKAYVLQTVMEEAEVRRLFNERVRSLFTELARKDIQVEGLGGTLLLHYGRRLQMGRVNELVDDTVNLRATLG